MEYCTCACSILHIKMKLDEVTQTYQYGEMICQVTYDSIPLHSFLFQSTFNVYIKTTQQEILNGEL